MNSWVDSFGQSAEARMFWLNLQSFFYPAVAAPVKARVSSLGGREGEVLCAFERSASCGFLSIRPPAPPKEAWGRALPHPVPRRELLKGGPCIPCRGCLMFSMYL